MASKTTLNAKNLEALGPECLARLLIEVSTGNAAAKRKLRLALAIAHGPREAAREITKQMNSIARARGFITSKTQKALIADLETQRRTIIEQVAPADPDEALALMWRFMTLAPSVFKRCDDFNGTFRGIFRQACADLGRLAGKVRPDPQALAVAVLNALQENDHAQYHGLIGIMAPTLGDEGLEALKSMAEELGRTPVPVPPKDQWEVMGWSGGRTIYEHEMWPDRRARMVTGALKDIADARGDVDGFIAQHGPKSRNLPEVAVEIAQRLLAAGRADEALGFLERAQFGDRRWVPQSWQELRLQALEALGRGEEAQAIRWDCFERTLSDSHLRAYLKRLPDFDDIEAEERAMAHAKAFPSLFAALDFLIRWPALDRAAELLVARHDEIDGHRHAHLVPAADVLSEHHPLAATLVLREMIDFTLVTSRSTRYRHDAEHLNTCARLARHIPDFGAFETHATFVARLKKEHGKKYRFWSLATAK